MSIRLGRSEEIRKSRSSAAAAPRWASCGGPVVAIWGPESRSAKPRQEAEHQRPQADREHLRPPAAGRAAAPRRRPDRRRRGGALICRGRALRAPADGGSPSRGGYPSPAIPNNRVVPRRRGRTPRTSPGRAAPRSFGVVEVVRREVRGRADAVAGAPQAVGEPPAGGQDDVAQRHRRAHEDRVDRPPERPELARAHLGPPRRLDPPLIDQGERAQRRPAAGPRAARAQAEEHGEDHRDEPPPADQPDAAQRGEREERDERRDAHEKRGPPPERVLEVRSEGDRPRSIHGRPVEMVTVSVLSSLTPPPPSERTQPTPWTHSPPASPPLEKRIPKITTTPMMTKMVFMWVAISP